MAHSALVAPGVALAAGVLLTSVLTTAQGGSRRTALEATLRSMIAASGAEVAVAFRTLDGRSEVLIDPDKPFHAASTMKVPVMEQKESAALMAAISKVVYASQ